MSRSIVHCWLFGLVLANLFYIPEAAEAEPDCPEIHSHVKQLVLVLTHSMASTTAIVRSYQRGNDGRWIDREESKPAVLGRNGLAWSSAFRRYASEAEPIKREGDGRTPAGFFNVGRAFGFSQGRGAGYVRIQKGKHFCVDDPSSPYYNEILVRSKAGRGVSGEDMAAIPLYREGLFLDYPTNRKERGGSCIFIHVWKNKNATTIGCVALSENDVKDLQSRSASGAAIMGILPQKTWDTLKSCFLNS
jgi:L,D-peptidoglycan transpeptidase YkuD (ErfK/YbiS/YcfS/YnhG family)